ncbi:MAG TPA: hypothetical protein VNE21_06725 [Mycobacteriales bacterium]|nr:hypothetical protein [Mycobacteriales bacterium]
MPRNPYITISRAPQPRTIEEAFRIPTFERPPEPPRLSCMRCTRPIQDDAVDLCQDCRPPNIHDLARRLAALERTVAALTETEQI